jgi:hypothetical protein
MFSLPIEISGYQLKLVAKLFNRQYVQKYSKTIFSDGFVPKIAQSPPPAEAFASHIGFPI